jgi:putative glutamine amidotransferase
LIAITGRLLPAGRVSGWTAASSASPVQYADAIARAGGHAVVLPPTELDPAGAADLVARFDGLLLSGGPDVDPARFDAAPHATVYGVDPLVDAFEATLTEAAVATGVPVLAICRGIQLLNVVLGGTLHQHLADDEALLPHGDPHNVAGATHEVVVEPGTRLAEALGTTTVTGESVHHQAVDRVGDGLSVSARTADGVVEGLELDDGWVVGVQWHPERTAAVDPVQQRLFDAFVDRARR